MANTTARFDPSIVVDVQFRVARDGSIVFEFYDSDGNAEDMYETEWEFILKKQAGVTANVLRLTTGLGNISVSGDNDEKVTITLTAALSNIPAFNYYYELYRPDLKKTWFTGTCFVSNGAYNASVNQDFVTTSTDEQVVRIALSSSGTPVQVYLSPPSQTSLNEKQDKAIVVSSNTTAANDGVYHVIASATFTDPTGVEGKGYTVFVRNGTSTVGGTPYTTAGTTIKRIYQGGAWASYIGTGGGGILGINTQTDDYTLVLGDASYVVDMNKATALTLTVPPNSSVAFPDNTLIYIRRIGVGVLTIAQGSGVTVTGSSGALIDPGLNVMMTLRKTGTNTWDLQNGSPLPAVAYVPTYSGFSVDPSSVVAHYVQIGKVCTVYLSSGVGTTNATTKTITLPIAAANTAIQQFAITTVVGSTVQTGRLATRVGSNVADVFSNAAGTFWPTSGNANILFCISYITV